MTTLSINNLHASVSGMPILKGIDITVSSGQVHAVMGPNGAGKSTLSAAVLGKPGYVITDGSVFLDDVDLLALPTWQRAHAGLHLVQQYPTEVPGVALADVVTEAFIARGLDTANVREMLAKEAGRINLPEQLLTRSVNVDMSGGEKKRNETMQLAVLKPKIAILDELDSGLDLDALRDCARRVEDATNEDHLGVLVITHYSRLLRELKPDVVHVLVKGRIVATGGPELVEVLERDGYSAFESELPEEPSSALDDLFGPPPTMN
jgi:Fe-S cluster assembly ATP-binding protein